MPMLQDMVHTDWSVTVAWSIVSFLHDFAPSPSHADKLQHLVNLTTLLATARDNLAAPEAVHATLLLSTRIDIDIAVELCRGPSKQKKKKKKEGKETQNLRLRVNFQFGIQDTP